MSKPGRPREFKEETKMISLKISAPLLTWVDAQAEFAGISRARLMNELLNISLCLQGIGMLEISKEHTCFRQVQDVELMREQLKPQWKHVADGLHVIFAHRDTVEERALVEEVE